MDLMALSRKLALCLLMATPAMADNGQRLEPSQLNLPDGATRPATCKLADTFYDRTQTAGENLFVCTATNTWTQVSTGGGSGSAPAGADVVIYKDGSNTIAKRTADNSGLYSGTDPGAAIQAGITDRASAGGGTILITSGTYTYTVTVPAFPPNAGPIKVSAYGAIIGLASGAPRTWDLLKAADGDTFQDITVEGGRTNGNLITGNAVVMFGFASAANQTRVNLKNIRLVHWKVYNVPFPATQTYTKVGIELSLLQSIAGDTTSMSARNVQIDDVEMLGVGYGIHMVGAAASGNPSGLDVYMDGIVVDRFRYDLSGDGTAVHEFQGENAIHIGSSAHGDSVTITNTTINSPPDGCIEVNGMLKTTMWNNACINPNAIGFTVKNFSPLTDAAQQSYSNVRFGCAFTAKKANGSTGKCLDISTGSVSAPPTYSFGDVLLSDGKITWTGMTNPALGSAISVTGAAGAYGLKSLSLDNISMFLDVDRDSTGALIYNLMDIEPEAADFDGDGTEDPARVSIRNLRQDVNITKASGSAGAINLRAGLIGGNSVFSMQNYTAHIAYNGTLTGDVVTGLYVGQPTGTIFQGGVDTASWNVRGEVAGARFLLYDPALTIPSTFAITNLNTLGVTTTLSPTDLDFATVPLKAQTLIYANNLRTTPGGTLPLLGTTGDVAAANGTFTNVVFVDGDGTNAAITYDDSGNWMCFAKQSGLNYKSCINTVTGQFKWESDQPGLTPRAIVSRDTSSSNLPADDIQYLGSGFIQKAWRHTDTTKDFYERQKTSDGGYYWLGGTTPTQVAFWPNAVASNAVLGYAGLQTNANVILSTDLSHTKTFINKGTATTIIDVGPLLDCAGFTSGGAVDLSDSNADGTLDLHCVNMAAGAGGGGDSVLVNGVAATNANLISNTTSTTGRVDFSYDSTAADPYTIRANVHADTIGPVELDEAAAYDFNAGTITLPGSNTLPGSCTGNTVYTKNNATTGQQIYKCESGTYVLQGGAPPGATYITQTPQAGLSAEQALSALATGFVKVTTSTGVLSSQAAMTDADVPDNITISLAATATALAVDPGNCPSGQHPLGIAASGAAQNCTADNPGSVTSVAVTTADGFSCSVASPTGAANLTCNLGDITPDSVTTTCTPASNNCGGDFTQNTGSIIVSTLGTRMGFSPNGPQMRTATSAAGAIDGGPVCNVTSGSVSAANCGTLNVTGSAAITAITGVDSGKTITLLCNGSTDTIADSAPFKLSAAFTCGTDDTLTLKWDGTSFWELSRSNN